MLLIVGTYSETLGHVKGKGSGLYVLNVEEKHDGTLAVKRPVHPEDTFFGRAQLGSGPDRLRNPTYLAARRDDESSEVHVYIVDEREDRPGTVSAARLDEGTGELTRLGRGVVADDGLDEVGGAACCHVSVAPDGRFVLAANYLSGSIVAVGRNRDGSLDPSRVQYVRFPPSSESGVTYPGPNARRQDRSHAHMVLFSPGRSSTTVLVPDLGSDALWSVPYLGPDAADGPLGFPEIAARHPSLAGGGPRHVALHPGGKVCYVAYELTSLVASFAVSEETGSVGGGQPLGIVNVLDGVIDGTFLSNDNDAPKGRHYERLLRESSTGLSAKICSDAETSVAAIRVLPDGSAVLVSSRIVDGEGAVSVISLGPGGELPSGKDGNGSVRIVCTLGWTPRDFVVIPSKSAGSDGDEAGGTAVLVANQDTDSIALLRNGSEAEMLTEEVPTPVCLCVVPS